MTYQLLEANMASQQGDEQLAVDFETSYQTYQSSAQAFMVSSSARSNRLDEFLQKAQEQHDVIDTKLRY